MRKVAWAVLRQLEALRESVAFTLKSGAIALGTNKSDQLFVEWLATQNVKPVFQHYVQEDRQVLSMLETIEGAIGQHGVDFLKIRLSSNYSRFDEPDVGPARSSGGWDRLPNFIISSALVRILGATEQFEIDVLKALLYYRPHGKQMETDLSYSEVELAVVIEQPDSDGRYSKPALWSWLKKSAENSVERRKIFRSVFDIDCFPTVFGKRKATEIRTYYQDLYEKRNALAHGRKLVDVTLGEYCEAEAFALTLVQHLSSVCADKYKLGV